MRRGRGRRGGALVAALATLAFSAALGAALADLVRTELRLAGERRLTARLLGMLDGCVADVVADLAAGWDFDAALAGADATPGTADDGVVPAPAGCTAAARRAPGGPVPDRALVRRTADAGAGALLWLSAPPEAGSIAGVASLDGADPTAPLATLAAPAAPEALDAWLAAESLALEISPGTDAPVSAPAPPLAELGARVLAAAHVGAEALVSSGAPAVGLAHVAGDLAIDDARVGAGLLFVEGSLEVRGSLAFRGVVVATTGLRVAPGASLAVDGNLWLGVGSPTLSVEGVLVLQRDSAAVAAADAVLPLPRRAVVAAARDVG